MRRRRVGGVRAWLVLVVLLLPLAQAKAEPPQPGIVNPTGVSTPTTLYMHMLGGEMPINTQVPDARFVNLDRSNLSTSSDCLPLLPMNGASRSWFGFSTSGYVFYDWQDQPFYHPFTGFPWDIRPDLSAPFTLRWFLETRFPVQPPAPAPVNPDSLVVLPDVAVRAWLRTGEGVSIGNDGYRAGRLLAEGETTGNLGGEALTRATSPSGSVVWHDIVDDQGYHRSVYEFTLEMAWQPDATFPADGGFGLEIAAFLPNPACPDPQAGTFMPGMVAPYAADGYWPRMDLAIFDAVRILDVSPTLLGDNLITFVSAMSAFGNYDIDESTTDAAQTRGGLSLAVEGPSPATSLQRGGIVQRTYEHDHQTEPVDAWYAWNLTQDGAADGTYTIRVSAANDQRTATATATAGFTLGKPVRVTGCAVQDGLQVCREQVATPDGKLAAVPAKATPAFGLGFALAGLAAAARLRRRA